MTDTTNTTDLPAAPRHQAPRHKAVAPAPAVDDRVVITEQQVLFGSAQALARAPHRSTHWAAVRRWFAGSGERRNYPARLNYLEAALLSRELDRL
ncbi:hypothetical protein H7J88_15525 [Mycolicibacterium flavescens]|uniref:Uncharacterized protein n=1 Tax=Mycolicibacterium flavescens TaxID=1776 RepID=A0A1E3RKF5_MYCFV|nr:hypothetical protein [Mycolicibacterium flavescens]MCV7281053.1 hypothetical protein [Mycolicibacterium flavescens]ODQ90351.1 hypothetical protein BHQ18_09815 [Mycolicibacterium flavescens]